VISAGTGRAAHTGGILRVGGEPKIGEGARTDNTTHSDGARRPRDRVGAQQPCQEDAGKRNSFALGRHGAERARRGIHTAPGKKSRSRKNGLLAIPTASGLGLNFSQDAIKQFAAEPSFAPVSTTVNVCEVKSSVDS
jgi:hypothetical protein